MEKKKLDWTDGARPNRRNAEQWYTRQGKEESLKVGNLNTRGQRKQVICPWRIVEGAFVAITGEGERKKKGLGPRQFGILSGI